MDLSDELLIPLDDVFYYSYLYLKQPNDTVIAQFPQSLFNEIVYNFAPVRDLIPEEIFFLLVSNFQTETPNFEELEPSRMNGKIFLCTVEPVFENFHYLHRSNRQSEMKTSRTILKINQKPRIKGKYRYIKLKNDENSILQERIYCLNEDYILPKMQRQYLIHYRIENILQKTGRKVSLYCENDCDVDERKAKEDHNSDNEEKSLSDSENEQIAKDDKNPKDLKVSPIDGNEEDGSLKTASSILVSFQETPQVNITPKVRKRKRASVDG